MKKIMFISFIGVSMLLVFIGLNSKSNYLREDNILGIYLDNKLQEDIPKKGEAIFSKAGRDNNATNIYWDIDKWGLFISNLSKKTKCNLYFVNYSGQTIFDFDYTGSEQTFTASVSGTYRLETWGAQGGNGGYGGYSVGEIKLSENSNLYIVIGGHGEIGNGYFVTDRFRGQGGFNGGGTGGLGQYYKDDTYWASGAGGGGTTSIQNILLEDGQLKNYSENISNVIIVAGGRGGVGPNAGTPGHGGGFKGNSSKSVTYENTTYGGKAMPGTQTGGYKFGLGQTALDKLVGGSFGCESNGGGGGGFYGGYANMTEGFGSDDSGGGGSGYIGNSLLKNKAMYCYNCEESNEENTKTISVTCLSSTPKSKCSKIDNGYARITLVSIDE